MPIPKSPCFEVEIADGIAHIRLSRAAELNTMTRDFWNDLPKIVKAIDDNALARVIVISSTGKHFTAGMDLSVFARPDGPGNGVEDPHLRAEKFHRDLLHLQGSFNCIDSARIPVIVAIQGGCIGGGVDLVTACDMRFATEDAFFCIQEINIGMTADVGTFPRLCHLMPEGMVRQMAYSGERLPAKRAAELGLVNEVFPTHEAMLKRVMALAAEIAARSPLAVAGSKAMINYARDHSIADCLDYVAVWNAAMLSPAHMREAMTAMKDKREPNHPDLLPLRPTRI